MGCDDVVPIKERDPVNQYFQGDLPGTIRVWNRVEVPFAFHQRIARYGGPFQVVVRILECGQGMHQVLLLNETLNRYVRTTIDRTGVNLGEARTEPFDRLLEGLERTSFTEGNSPDVADTFFIGSLLVRRGGIADTRTKTGMHGKLQKLLVQFLFLRIIYHTHSVIEDCFRNRADLMEKFDVSLDHLQPSRPGIESGKPIE